MKLKKAVVSKPSEPASVLLSVAAPDDLRWEMQSVQLALARRAYELFEARGCEHGHDWEDWFRAESELLRPVSISMKEIGDHVSVRANVLGFSATELRVTVEPSQIIILGKKEPIPVQAEVASESVEPDLILKTIELPIEVLPESGVIEFQSGVLSFEVLEARARQEKGRQAAA